MKSAWLLSAGLLLAPLSMSAWSQQLDFDKVQIDPWPTGNFGREIEDNRRITRCLSYYRENPTDNGYARPIEGVIATVDGARGEVGLPGPARAPPARQSGLPDRDAPGADAALGPPDLPARPRLRRLVGSATVERALAPVRGVAVRAASPS